MKKIIREGKAKAEVYSDIKISKDLPVFYNPLMKLNRDISALLLSSIGKKKIRAADVLAGSGVRSLRFLLELKRGVLESISINDASSDAVKLIRRNLKLNKILASKRGKVKVFQKDGNMFLLESEGFDYIDIDPFGSPVPFLDCAIKRLSREGILAVTATDTAPLCGTYPKTCLRRYWSIPKKCGMMHEIGLRILIRRVQLIGAQYDKALVPIFSYSHEHYFRVFFQNRKGKNDVDAIMKRHGMLNGAGPLWLSDLWDESLAKNMRKNAENSGNEAIRFLTILEEESAVPAAGFYDTHELCKRSKIPIPKKEALLNAIRSAGFLAAPTHFKGEGIRSTIPQEKLLDLLSSRIP